MSSPEGKAPAQVFKIMTNQWTLCFPDSLQYTNFGENSGKMAARPVHFGLSINVGHGQLSDYGQLSRQFKHSVRMYAYMAFYSHEIATNDGIFITRAFHLFIAIRM